jgi:VWFA-related protein
MLAATPEPWTVTSAQVPQFRAGVDLVQLDVSVLDRSGQPVRGLAAADFTVLEDGLPQRLQAFSAVDIPVPVQPTTPWMRDVAPDVRRNDEVLEQRVFVILFNDLTLPPNPATVKFARDMGHSIINRMGPTDLVAVTFLVSNQNAQEFTNDRSRLLAAVNAVAARAGVAAHSPDLHVLAAIAESLAALPQRRKAVFYISGGAAVDPMDPLLVRVIRNSQRANVNIYGLHPGNYWASSGVDAEIRDLTEPVRLTQKSDGGDSYLQTLAENTGGRALLRTHEFDEFVNDVFIENGSYYLLGYVSTSSKPADQLRRLDVRVNRPGMQVRARNGYYPPDPVSGRSADRRLAGLPPDFAALHGVLGDVLPKADLPLRATTAVVARPGSREASVIVQLGVREPSPPAGQQVLDTLSIAITASDSVGRVRPFTMEAEVRVRPAGASDLPFDVVAEMRLPPGRHRLRAAATSRRLGTSGSVFLDVDVPNFQSAPLALSGLVIHADPAWTAVGSRRAVLSILPLVPTTRRDFSAADRVTAFVRVYRSGRDLSVPVTLTTTVLDGNGAQVGEAVQTVGPVRTTDISIDLGRFALGPGPHLLTVEARAGRDEARRQMTFTRH